MNKNFLVSLFFISLVTQVSFGGSRAEQSLNTIKAPYSKNEYFVIFREGLNLKHKQWLRNLGVTQLAFFSEAKAIHIKTANTSLLNQMKSNPTVELIEPVPMRYPLDLANEQLSPYLQNGLYGLLTTYSTDAQSRGVFGSGINVGIADTGLDYTHPDIASNYRGGVDVVSNDSDPWWNNDPREVHATHVAGIILGVNNSLGIFGVAPQSNLYHARVLGPNGGSASNVMTGVQKLVIIFGCKVVNLSLGGTISSRTEEKFYNSMRNTYGALIVAAAGNDGRSKLSYPAGYATNIAVGAVDNQNKHASFSNSGKNLDFSAPGVSVLSSVPKGQGFESSVTTSVNYGALPLQYGGETAGITQPLVDCGLGGIGECTTDVFGKIALINRGTYTFAEKVTNVMNQGAVGAIIYNNVSGSFRGTLGATTTSDGRFWIPAVSVSDVAGFELKNQIGIYTRLINQKSDWDTFDGTSMATPYVAGAIALIWSANPGLSNSSVESYLRSTAKDLGYPGYDTTFGYGLINVSAAVALAGR